MSQYVFDTSLEGFEDEVIQLSHQYPVLLDMWADWCPPCVVISPILNSIVEEYDGVIRLAKLEVDEGDNMKIAGRYQVRGFPTIILLHKGEEKARFSGAKTAAFVRDFVDEHID